MIPIGRPQNDFVKVKRRADLHCIAMLNELAPVLAKRGMKLLGSYGNVVGRLNTVVDFWELADANTLQAALSDPELQKMASHTGDIIEDETLVLLTKLPIG
jgi:hypothetical protein